MNLKPFLKNNDEALLLARIEEVEGVKILLRIIKQIQNETDRSNRTNPMISDEIRKDIRYKLGKAENCEEILGIVPAARHLVSV